LTDHVHLAVLFGFIDESLNYFCWDCEICCAWESKSLPRPTKMIRFRRFDAHDRVATQKGKAIKSEGGTHHGQATVNQQPTSAHHEGRMSVCVVMQTNRAPL
jgi:hypothetical protein